VKNFRIQQIDLEGVSKNREAVSKTIWVIEALGFLSLIGYAGYTGGQIRHSEIRPQG